MIQKSKIKKGEERNIGSKYINYRKRKIKKCQERNIGSRERVVLRQATRKSGKLPALSQHKVPSDCQDTRQANFRQPPGTSKQNTPNTFDNLDKYILLFGKYTLHVDNFLFAIWTNTFSNLDKYILELGGINFAI